MRQYEIRSTGSIDNIALAERAERPLQAGEVRVAIRAASLNFRDLTVVRGMFPAPLPANCVPLSDGAGEVIEVGANVGRVKIGDRVTPTFKQTWIGGEIEPHDNSAVLGGGVDGVLAETAVFNEAGLVKMADNLSYEDAACLPCAALTAWSALQDARQIKAGDTVLVLGTGGVATFAIQFASAAGARVIVTSSSDAKIERAKALGAADGVNYAKREDWDVAARELTGGRGVDLVVETGGGGTMERSVNSCRLGGAISLVGVITQGTINPLLIMRSNLIVRGIGVGSRKAFDAMNRAIAANDIKPVIDKVFPFEQALDAYRYLEKAGHFGKVVIKVG